VSSLSKRKKKKILQATLSLENETTNSIFSFVVFASSYILISAHSKSKTSWYVILIFFFYRESFLYIKKKPNCTEFLGNTTVGCKFSYENSEDLEVHADQAKLVIWKLDTCATFSVNQPLIKIGGLKESISQQDIECLGLEGTCR